MKDLTLQDLETIPTILVVEDEEDMRQNLVELLGDNYRVLTAANGEEALRIYYNEQFRLSVVLLDIRLPDINGIEVLNHMKKMNLNPDVIMVTALSDTETAVKAMREGAYDYITKPFLSADLTNTIKRALEKEDYARKLKELTDRLERERIATEHRKLLFAELQMNRRVEGRDLTAEEKALFNFPVLPEEDYDYEKLKKKLQVGEKTKVEVGVGGKVLILINDNKLNNYLKDVLSSNYQVLTFSTGADLFAQLKKEPADVILLDINLKDINGIELLKKISHEYASIDVIMVTEVKDVEAAVNAIKAGAYDYITEPFMPEDVKAAVMRLMEKRTSKKILEDLLEKYQEIRLSFEPRLKMLKELFKKRKAEKKKINLEDVYTFYPEFHEGVIPLDVEVNFPTFKDEAHLDRFIRQIESARAEKNG